MLLGLRRSCYVGLQPAVTKGIGMAARMKASVMLRHSWQVGLQLEVAKGNATAARQVVLDHTCSAVLVPCWILKLEVAKYIATAARREELC